MSDVTQGHPVHNLPAAAFAKPKGIDWLANRLLRTFYRRLEVVGAEKIPRDRPLVLVGNHVNGLLDPALFIGFLPVKPRFLAKSTLWQTAVLRPFLKMAAAIPVYRRQDPGVDPEKNAETFQRCHEVLAAGGAIAIFPEGTSHNEPALVPLKTGVSRIVLQAEERFGAPDAPLGTRIVPVGLTFDDKGRFRSRVLIHVGDPIDPSPEVVLFCRATRESESRDAVLALTARVRAALEGVTLNYETWREAELISRATEIWSRPEDGAVRELPLEKSFSLQKVFSEGYEELLDLVPERVHAVAERVADYDRQLDLYHLGDEQVASGYPPRQVVGFVMESLALILLRLPLGAVGTLMNYLPYRAVGRFAHWKSPSPDVDATYKLLASLLFFPLIWLAWSAGAFFAAKASVGDAWLWAASVLLLGPVTGYIALRLHQRRELFWRQARAFLRLRLGGRGVEDLRRMRRAVRASVEELAEEWRASRG